MDNPTEAFAQAAIDLGRKQPVPSVFGDAQFVVHKNDEELHSLESLGAKPMRKKGIITVRDTTSFLLYFKIHQLGSAIYGSYKPPKFTAVFNDHQRDDAGWGDHRMVYDCPHSPEWATWIGSDGRQMPQVNFAEFLEDNLPDVIASNESEPTGAQMLEVAQSFTAKSDVNFSSAVRLQNGTVQFTYEETTEAKSRGDFKVPEKFFIGIAVFEQGPKYRMEARLRYRINGGKLMVWYDILRPHKILEDAVKNIWDEIQTGTTVQIIHGTPRP